MLARETPRGLAMHCQVNDRKCLAHGRAPPAAPLSIAGSLRVSTVPLQPLRWNARSIAELPWLVKRGMINEVTENFTRGLLHELHLTRESSVRHVPSASGHDAGVVAVLHQCE